MIIASFFAHRYQQWEGVDYLPLLRLLDASCRRLGLRHMVIGDKALPGLETAVCGLPENLMAAILDGQRQLLEWAQEPILFVGADCLIAKDPRPIMAGDLTITISPTFSDCVMNTGAIWCADPARCATVWADALRRNPSEWGSDQTALYAAMLGCDLDVRGVRAEDHNWAPRTVADAAGMPTVVHFRGPRKRWMADWAKRHMDLTC